MYAEVVIGATHHGLFVEVKENFFLRLFISTAHGLFYELELSSLAASFLPTELSRQGPQGILKVKMKMT